MKRKAFGFLFVILILAALLFAFLHRSSKEPEAVYNSISEVDSKLLSELEDRAVSVMLLSKDIYKNAGKGSTYNVILSDETVSKIVDAIGEEGYSAIDCNGNVNMKNPEALEHFGKQVNAEKNADATYYLVQPDGIIHMNKLSYSNGVCKQIVISVEWGDDFTPSIYSEGQYTLNSVSYTEKGWLILDRDISNFNINKKFNVDSHTLIRVKPYDETCRQLCEKYISPVGYSENNLFTVSWQETDLSELDLNCLYPILYGLYYDKDSLTMYSANALYGMIDNTYLSLVPAKQFEEVTGAFFDIPSNQIRNSADFSSKDNGYFMCGYQTGYYNVVPRLPEPEVVDYRYNDDGTLTLIVDAVFSWYGTDKAFTHETTIRETDTGFQYVSNRVLDSENNIFPETILQGERLIQMKQYCEQGL